MVGDTSTTKVLFDLFGSIYSINTRGLSIPRYAGIYGNYLTNEETPMLA